MTCQDDSIAEAHHTGLLREMLASETIVPVPGVYDALSAFLAERAGFRAVFVSGSALAFAKLARPDVNLLTLTELADTVASIRDRVNIPVVVDVDSGYGSALNVARTVRTLERAGASGLQIEDQVNFKPPGDLTTRVVVSAEEMVVKLKAAQDARYDRSMVISARTDAFYTLGVDEAFHRADLYADAGADMLFVEGLGNRNDMERLVQQIGGRVPLLHNMGDGLGDVNTVDDAQLLGYSIALFPGVAIGSAACAIAKNFSLLRAGTTAAFQHAFYKGSEMNTVLEVAQFANHAKALVKKKSKSVPI